MKYIGIDGDNIGSKIELYFLENNEESIQIFSGIVEKTVQLVALQLKELGMTIIFSGGDSILCRSDTIDIEKLRSIITVEAKNEIRFSVGIGETMKQAYIALKYAKTSGKDRIVILEDDQFKALCDHNYSFLQSS